MSTLDLHERVAHDQAVLAAAIHGSRDERRCGFRLFHFQFGATHHAHGDGLGIADGVSFAATATENPASVVVVGVVVVPRHQGAIDTHLSAADGHLGQTIQCRVGQTGFRCFQATGNLYSCPIITIGITFVIIGDSSVVESAHVAQLSAAVDTAFHSAVGHVDYGMTQDQSGHFVGQIALAAAIDGAFN